MTVFTVDRIEGSVVVLEDENGDTLSISADTLPPGITAGTVLRCADGIYTPDAAETARRRQTALALEKKLREKFSC